jgi:phosphate transport system protein
MLQHFKNEIERLKKSLLSLSATVEERVQMAVRALETRDGKLAKSVVDGDTEIDRTEVDIEEECLKILALYQPVAGDLRFVVAVLKINNDLERIADLAVNIAERAAYLATQEKVDVPLDFALMEKKTQQMLKNSIDALVNVNPQLAYEVCAADEEVDNMNRQMYIDIQNGIRKSPDKMESLIHLLSVSRHLERIADHATNIAEDIIYMYEGQIVRHHTEEYKQNIKK